jgi:hypothetical protein
MHKYFLIAAAFFVLASTPTFAIYSPDAEPETTKTMEATTADRKTMLMTATDDVATSRIGAKDAMKEEVKAARDEFKAKMLAIKDAAKQKALSNIDIRISEINTKRTTHMGELLDRFTTILSKISTRAAALKAEGKNTTALLAEIDAATETLNDAKAAVAEQSAKDYVVDITTDTALKTNASATVKQFMTDLKAVHQLVVAAQKAVVKVFRSVAQLQGGTKVTPTVSTTVTPSSAATP